MKTKRWIAALLCVLLIGCLFPTSAFAADIASGTGWNLSDDGVLHITGDIPESGFDLTDEQKQQVKSVVAESGASISSGEALFDGFENMTSADLRLLNTTGVRDMSSMFMSCSSLTSLDVSGFDTSSVTDMNYMFYGCSSLTSLNLSNFNTISVTTMGHMFENCSNLTSLDVSSFETDRLMYAKEMFRGCSALTSLGISPDILYENADCIIAIRSPWQKKGSTDTYSTADELKAVTDIVTLLAVYTVNVQNDGNGTASANPAAAVKDETVTLTATPNNGYHFKEWQSSDVTVSNNTFTMPEKEVTVKAIFEADAPTTYTGTGWNLDADGVLHITGDIPNSGFDLSADQKLKVKSVVAESGASISSGRDLFDGFKNMTSANLRLLNTTGVTNMGFMFCDCSRLTSLDLSSFDTSSVSNMNNMFKGCISLTSLNLSSFDTSSVTGMSSMFLGCRWLTSIDLSKFETGNVTSMDGMFWDCHDLTSLDLSSFDTSSVTGMSEMFAGCSSLTSLDVSGFDTSSVREMQHMFSGCTSLTALGITPHILSENADDIIAIHSPWQKKGSTDTYSTADELKAVTDTVTLLAMYTVNVQNDGNGTASANPTSAVKGDTVTLTATPDAGYRFKEWQSTDVTVTDNKFTMPAKAVTVTAVFEAIPTYSVTFDMNGHGTQVTEQTVEEGNKATKPSDPTAEGWTFGGWYVDTDFSAMFDFNTAINANTTIYAKWTENPGPQPVVYTIIVGAGSEWTKGETEGLLITSDAPFAKFSSVKVDESTIAATNYAAAEGSTKITLAPAYLETLSVGTHSIEIVSNDGSASTNFTIKAAVPPVPTSYTVTFNMNGHGTQITAQTVESGSKVIKPADPTARGYTFDGWYADAAFSAKFDFNTAITENTTVYAKWTKNSAAPTDPTSPQTGDTSNMFLWIALLFVSGGALVGTTVYGKKRKSAE